MPSYENNESLRDEFKTPLIKKRLDRESMFMRIAGIVSERSTCPRKSVGAVIVRKNRIISMGYNGAPPGMPHCTDVGCGGGVGRTNYNVKPPKDERVFPYGCTRAIHAEMNAIAFAARQGAPTDDATMYSTCATCANCAALLVSSGITHFVYFETYRIKDGQELLEAAGIEVVQWTA